MMTASWRALPFSFLLGGCAALGSSRGESTAVGAPNTPAALRQAIDSMIAAPELRSATWGILIVDPLAADTL